MVTRRPLVLQDGSTAELPSGITVSFGTLPNQAIAGSGLVGGGPVSSNPRLDLALATNPSGIIFVGDALGLDGSAQVTASSALASGSAAASLADSALASGNASLVTANAASASGNAALTLIPTLSINTGLTAYFTTSSAVVSGYVIGLDDQGKASSVRSVVTDNSNPISFPSSAVVFKAGTGVGDDLVSSVYDVSSGNIVITYRDLDNSNYGTAIVGTVSGTSISFGTPVVFASANAQNPRAIYDASNSKVVVAYSDQSDGSKGKAVVGTVSGTSISFGTAVEFDSSATSDIAGVYDSTNGRIVLIYRSTGSNKGTGIVGTVSGTSISFGAIAYFTGGNAANLSSAFDSSNSRVVVSYKDAGGSGYGTTIIGTVSGTSISYGTAVVFDSSNIAETTTAYDSTNARIVVGWKSGVDGYSYGIVGTVSGTSISFGTQVLFEAASASNPASLYDPDSNRVVFAYRDGGNSNYGTAIAGTVSGTSISFGSASVFESANAARISIAYDSVNKKIVISYQDNGNTKAGTSIVADTLITYSYFPTLNSRPNVLGISQSTVASGETCAVNLPGTLYNDPTASLTLGAFYYPNPTTSGITVTSGQPTQWNGDVPWNYIGRAVTSSGLMLLKSI